MRSHIDRATVFCISLIGLCSLVACGFQLRGLQGDNVEIEAVYLSGVNTRSELLSEIAESLRNRGINISSSSESVLSLHVVSENINRRPVATSADISVSEYELRMEVVFQAMTDEGQNLIPPTPLFVERIYSFDNSSLVGSSEEENIVVEEMRREIASKILQRLNSVLQEKSLQEQALLPKASQKQIQQGKTQSEPDLP
ncbi:MAG: LPS-assembly lipoprotein [Candidatus Azotimanducaceae bacterium]|jgi:LPS-assembly lipoprotein